MAGARRILALVVVMAIFAVRLDRQMIRLPFLNRRPISAALTQRPDRLWPPFPRFLAGVRERTARGDSIAIITPSLAWDQGYSYAYYRASYLLAGRVVLPVASSDGRLLPENLRRAQYVAVWGRGIPADRRAIVWQGEGGVLLRR